LMALPDLGGQANQKLPGSIAMLSMRQMVQTAMI